jgi:hypothetical protein
MADTALSMMVTCLGHFLGFRRKRRARLAAWPDTSATSSGRRSRRHLPPRGLAMGLAWPTACRHRAPQRNRYPDAFGSVRRPNLLGDEHSLGLAHSQRHSVRRLGQEVADAAAVLPTHGFGSHRSCPAGRKAGHSAPAAAPRVPSRPLAPGLSRPSADSRRYPADHDGSAATSPRTHRTDLPSPSASRQQTSLTTANRNEPR